jgi:hypothetical protein
VMTRRSAHSVGQHGSADEEANTRRSARSADTKVSEGVLRSAVAEVSVGVVTWRSAKRDDAEVSPQRWCGGQHGIGVLTWRSTRSPRAEVGPLAPVEVSLEC